MIKIALVSNTGFTIYNFRKGLILELQKMGFEIVILCQKDEFYEKICSLKVKFIEIKLDRKGINPIQDFILTCSLIKIYKKERFNFIFHYTIKPNIFGSIAAGFVNTPAIAVTTGLGYTFINNNIISKIAKVLYRVAFKFPKEIWFLNQDDKNTFINKKLIDSSKNVIVLPGEGVNTIEFHPQEKDSQSKNITFLLISRLLWDKGIREYTVAAERILKQHPHAEFQILGSFDFHNPSSVPKEFIMELHNRGIIKYLGSTADVRKFIRECDCVVLPSYREGIPRTLLEAMAMAKPIITSNAPGCKETVEDGVNGFICQVKDTEDLSAKFNTFLQLPEKTMIEFGNAGRKKVLNEFDEGIIINFYREALLRYNIL